MRHLVSIVSISLFLFAFTGVARAQEEGEVLIYTGTTQWIAKASADVQAEICVAQLEALGITNTLLQSDADMEAVADWVDGATDNGRVDVLVLYGDFPPTIYPQGNAMPDDSFAELFIESEDGDAIINHADYMFWGLAARNSEGGLQNMMDIPGIVMWDDNTPVQVTDDGRDLIPSLEDYMTDRPFHIDQLADEWEVEISFAQNAAGTRADPIVVRDGDRGRLIPCIQTNGGSEPKGAIAAEIIAWLYEKNLAGVSTLALSGAGAGLAGVALKYTVETQDNAGGRRPVQTALTVNIATDSATGRFDVAADGSFDATATSVTIAAGQSSAEFYYKDTTEGTAKISATAAGLDAAEFEVTIAGRDFAPPGEVAIYTGTTQWIGKSLADEQAQICVDLLDDAGIENQWFQNDFDMELLAEWVEGATGNGVLDVLVLYGDLPPTLYPDGNAMPDDSIGELFIESEDGDAIINHADYMFWGLAARNGEGGLQNMMDIPGIVMWDDNTPVTVTPEGADIAPSLTDFLTDRPMHIDQLAGNWLVEVSLAQNAAGTRADPIIVRDGNRGRLIPVFQTADGPEPKGAVAAEIIIWMFEKELSGATQLVLVGPGAGSAGAALGFDVQLQDSTGSPRPAQSDVTVSLATDSATGAFDTASDGAFDGSVTSVTVAAGATSARFYYKDTSEGAATLTASAAGLDGAEHEVRLFSSAPVAAGEVAIYTGTTQWITKALADAQAQICVNQLDDEGITNTWYQSDIDMEDVAAWVDGATDNGRFDVLVLYGDLPPTLYPDGNAMPDDSIAELFIESPDGDAIINHADYMFWGLAARNGEGGLQNMMDIPGIVMWDDNTPVTVTPEGAAIAPSLTDYMTDRPMHTDQLDGDWFTEVSLAQNASGTRADPIIVRDGTRGRLIPVIQTADGPEPKGAVAAEIITWMMEEFTSGEPSGPRFIRGDHNADGAVNIADPVATLNSLFSGGAAASCQKTADANDDGTVNIADPVHVLNGLFSGGPAPLPPNPDCGEDPTEDALTCETYAPCAA